jgi:hypothetical protein
VAAGSLSEPVTPRHFLKLVLPLLHQLHSQAQVWTAESLVLHLLLRFLSMQHLVTPYLVMMTTSHSHQPLFASTYAASVLPQPAASGVQCCLGVTVARGCADGGNRPALGAARSDPRESCQAPVSTGTDRETVRNHRAHHDQTERWRATRSTQGAQQLPRKGMHRQGRFRAAAMSKRSTAALASYI